MTRTFAPYRSLDAPRPPDDQERPFDPRERRRRWLRGGDPVPGGDYVLYWMQMYKRTRSNVALDEAARRARELGLPLVVYEGLNPDYPGANRRIHRFVLECARDTARELARRGVPYVFGLRRSADGRRRPAVELVRGSALTVVDDYPAFVLPGVTRRAVELTAGVGTPVLAVDDNGVVPLDEMGKRHYAARTIRPRIHERLPAYLHRADTLDLGAVAGAPPLPVGRGEAEELAEAADADLASLVAACDVDRDVPPSRRFPGGREAGLERLRRFVEERLADYGERSSDPGAGVESGLSPYLHFGCLSAREVALEVLAADAPDASVDAFLEQLVVRRELAFNFCRFTPLEDHASLEVLPDWARNTLAEHADDERERVYAREKLERAATHDEVWNAAQRELRATGKIHNYMRMLWGKKILTWTESYKDALQLMLEMHDRWALDGRDPATYANVLWCFGLHDRAFGERPVFGKLRPMTSESTRRKHDVEGYLRRVDGWESALGEGRGSRDR